MSENCPMETVSGKLEIRVIDRHLNGNDNYCDVTNSKPIICLEEDDEGLLLKLMYKQFNKYLTPVYKCT